MSGRPPPLLVPVATSDLESNISGRRASSRLWRRSSCILSRRTTRCAGGSAAALMRAVTARHGCAPRRSHRPRHDCAARPQAARTTRRSARRRPRFGCFVGTFSPSRRRIRASRLTFTSQHPPSFHPLLSFKADAFEGARSGVEPPQIAGSPRDRHAWAEQQGGVHNCKPHECATPKQCGSGEHSRVLGRQHW